MMKILNRCLLAASFFITPFMYSFPIGQSNDEINNSKLNVYFIDVGMGDAIFLEIPPKDCMLIDAGSWDNFGIENLVQFLNSFFNEPGHEPYKKTIDVVLATHQHKDHIQGMLNILNAFKVSTYIDNGVGCKFEKSKAQNLVKDIEKLLKLKSIKHTQITDELVTSKGIKGLYTDSILDPFESIDVFALAATPKPIDKNENDNSIVLKVQCDSVSFLLTGDAEIKEEKVIIDRLKSEDNIKAIDIDVLKAGHHGSNTASGEEFLQLTSPEISVIMVGVASESPMTQKFRLPKESVVSRIADNTSNVLNEEWEIDVFPDKKPKGAKKEKPKPFKSKKEIYVTSYDGTFLIRTDGKNISAEIYEYNPGY